MDTYDEVDKTYRDMKNSSSREYESVCPTVEREEDIPDNTSEERNKEVMEELHYWGVIWDVQSLIKQYGWEVVKKDIMIKC